MTIGLSIGLGGVGTPLLGLLADAHGLRAAFEVIAGLPVLALLLTWLLPARNAASGPTRVARLSASNGASAATVEPEAACGGQERAAQRRNPQRSAL